MAQSTVSTVPFHGNNLYLVNHNNEPYTPMRPIVEGMGLSWKPQFVKLSNNQERWAVTIMVTTVGGQRKESLCMPVRKLPAFMASVNPNKVRPELRDTIILYQNECDDVLWNYWNDKVVKKQVALTEKKVKALPLPTPTIWHCLPDSDRSEIHSMVMDMRRRWDNDVEKFLMLLRFRSSAIPPQESYIHTARMFVAQMHYALDGFEQIALGMAHLERHLNPTHK